MSDEALSVACEHFRWLYADAECRGVRTKAWWRLRREVIKAVGLPPPQDAYWDDVIFALAWAWDGLPKVKDPSEKISNSAACGSSESG